MPALRRPAIALALALATVATATAQRTTRPNLKLDAQLTATAKADTAADARITISGYEKTLRSTKESLLATNEGRDTVAAIGVTIDYLDTTGRQIHRRSIELTSADPIEPSQTRQLVFKSWDSQKVWYYRLSQPSRTNGQATPYDVVITVDYALKPAE